MAIRGTKKSVEALEILFETGKKPTQQDFFDWMSSYYHKDEDISFLISIAKATLTDVQTGIENNRFMTSLRTYQSILWWARLSRHPLLQMDVEELVSNRITATLNQLMATDDSDNIINTLGELFLAFQNFNEETGGINNLRNRIGSLEWILFQVPNNQRQVQNTFDSLSFSVSNAQSKADDAWNRANAAQTKADDAWNRANTAQSKADDAWNRANNAQSSANTAQSKADDAWNRANNAQNRADDAHNRTSDIYNKIGNVSGYNIHNEIQGIKSFAQLDSQYMQNETYDLKQKMNQIFSWAGLAQPY